MCGGFSTLRCWALWRCAWRSFRGYFGLLSGTDQRQLEIIKLRVFVKRVARIANCHIQRQNSNAQLVRAGLTALQYWVVASGTDANVFATLLIGFHLCWV